MAAASFESRFAQSVAASRSLRKVPPYVGKTGRRIAGFNSPGWFNFVGVHETRGDAERPENVEHKRESTHLVDENLQMNMHTVGPPQVWKNWGVMTAQVLYSLQGDLLKQLLDAEEVGLAPGSITQDAGQSATGRPFGGTSGCNLMGPDHKPKAQVYGRRVPPPRQNSPVSTSQQKAVACLPFAECMRDHRSACSTSEEGSQLIIKPVSWPEKGVNGAGKTECGVPRTRRSALRELTMTEIETTCEIFVLSGPDGPTSAGKNGRYPESANMVCAWVQSIVGNGVSGRKARPPHIKCKS
ncbi:hypothetical protein C8J57DRAFT_1482172 [Mycena rebaudengoi]|nr:hypothetical protein C8J57DRAFT_1482172 [Mycena rebaudengoi]